MKDENQEHPSPEVLADLVEGVAVDAIWKLHVSRCTTCAKEVESLQTTLDAVSAIEVPERDKEYWDGFDARLKNRIVTASKKRSRRWVWAASAAAVVAGGFWASAYWTGIVKPYPAVWSEVVLPPVEEDNEYQVLLSFAEVLADTEDWIEALEDQPNSEFDPSQLTADQTEALQQKLKRDIEVMNNAKS